MSTCGMRWPVASNVAPTSGLVEIVTSGGGINMDGTERGDEE
jgi:hypothetical protein